jgi:RecB family exonuclease
MDGEIEELRRRGLLVALELRTLGDTELDRLLRPHKIRQVEAAIDALVRRADAAAMAGPEQVEAAETALAEVRWALAECLDRMARVAMTPAPKLSA